MYWDGSIKFRTVSGQFLIQGSCLGSQFFSILTRIERITSNFMGRNTLVG